MLDIKSEKNFNEITVPLPLYESVKIASAAHEDLGVFSIYVGLSKEHVEDIKAYSLDLSDKALQEATSDYERFGKGDYEQRYKTKKRIQFVLVHDATGDLAATIWYGPRELPEGIDIDPTKYFGEGGQWYTSSYRTYGSYRGVRITTAFSKYIIDLYKQSHPESPMWLGVQKNNEPGVRLYSKLGFEIAASDDTEGEHIMTLQER